MSLGLYVQGGICPGGKCPGGYMSGGGGVVLSPVIILLPAATSIVLPVGYMDQPTGLFHIIPGGGYVAARGGGYSDNLLRRFSG